MDQPVTEKIFGRCADRGAGRIPRRFSESNRIYPNRAFRIKTPTDRTNGTLDPKLPRDTMKCFAVSRKNFLCTRVSRCIKAVIHCRISFLISFIVIQLL